ncbi:peptidyl-tRNA hydrolase [[Clostridium] ultunense Esp]|uniref:aminoacyl-tRNA hydrolase n=1 Tax=Thermicanus aegyptius TaxID=94009 RepID=UPI0002B6F7BA|nr:aminoacyl-tRNA hydrolase [Thermicanus aegyptius]CCQ98195.1 peptidyl-tRNA hydrolase [[Clostridium] ultunense Esp]
MKWIVGLGNPGEEYEKTRHNIGFQVVDLLAKEWSIPMRASKWQALIGEAKKEGERILLTKPLTYMNRSGDAVRKIMDWYKLSCDDLLVIYDDLDLPVGNLRLREKGSAGGHNGMKSIIQQLGTEQFKRIRVGIGHPPAGASVPEYVLSPFEKEEKEKVDAGIKLAAQAANAWLSLPFPQVMNRFNRKSE